MKKSKTLVLTALSFSLMLSPVISTANSNLEEVTDIVEFEETNDSSQRIGIITFSLANAPVTLSRSGNKFTATANIMTGSSVNSRMTFQRKSGTSWVNMSTYSSSKKTYSKTFTASSRGTYRILLKYTIGSSSDTSVSKSITY
ncbi:hypothetical protein [Miniphocaeibacter massiliensis]|uniref:hypothetical protein n=1 Tax=Miniphocaeibacter massiliensis TaxID=2041841 RepID=UPI000C1C18DD|nr:hypothetical protein [Miniphocaeibacter massiliensis]